MKKKLIVLLGIVVTIAVLTGASLQMFKNKDYSSTVTFEEATALIEHVRSSSDEVDFEYWDIQKIDNELFLISYSDEEVFDVYKSDRSWIVSNMKVVYMVDDGRLVSGEKLDIDIAKKFNHNIKTYDSESVTEPIEFEKEEVESKRVKKGQTTIFQKGEFGEKEIISDYEFVNGLLVETVLTENVLKDPVNEVTLVGTYEEPPAPPPPPPVVQAKPKDDIVGGRKLTWYNVKYNRDGSLSSWGSKMYGGHTFTSTGCVPTALAIAMSGYDVHKTPSQVGDLLYNNGLFNSSTYIGTGGKGVKFALESYGLNHTGITSQAALSAALKRGNVVVAAIQTGKFGIGNGTHMVVLNGFNNGQTYVTDPTYSQKSSNASISSLWNGQSYDTVDRELGYVFFEITGGGFVPNPKPEEPKDEFITLKELKDLSIEEVDAYLKEFGITAKYNVTVEYTENLDLDGKSKVTTSTDGQKHNLSEKVLELSVIVYEYKAPDPEPEPEPGE